MIIPAGFAQVSIHFGGVGLPTGAVTTWGIDQGLLDTPDAVAADNLGIFNTFLMPFVSDTVSTTLCEVKFGPNDVGPVGTDTAGTAGGEPGDQAPPNVAWLLTKRTALGGRANRGRMFIPGPPEAFITASGTMAASALQTAADDFLDALATTGTPMVILHNGTGDPTPVTQLISEPRVATQRRRLRR